MSSEPKPLEISVSSSVGGKVQIIKFEYSEDYHFSQTEKWSVPEDWTDEQVAEFRKTVQAKLDAAPAKLWSLNEMERTDGEPDVVGYDKKSGEFIFYDCQICLARN